MAAIFGSGSNLPDVMQLRTLARDSLVHLLESVMGQKDLVLDAELMRPLDRIAGASLLKEHGVNKIFKLEAGANLQGSDQRIYLVRPKISLLKLVCNQINADVNSGVKRKYKIIYTPRRLHVCDMLIEQEGVYGYVSTAEFQLDFIPLDRDLISMEVPEFFTSFFLYGDHSWVHTAARGLATVQQVFGRIPCVHGIGRCAKMIHDMTKVIFENEGEPNQLNNGIGHLIIIDRNADYITPLLSQVTYEGILDDTFGISSGFVEFGPEVTSTDKKIKLLLTSQDRVFEDIRDRHFSNVFGYLGAKAKELQSGYDKRHGLTSVREMKDFVANDLKDLKQAHKSLSLHIAACEHIVRQKTKSEFEEGMQTEHSLLEGSYLKENLAYIEEVLNKQGPMLQALRLLCLASLTQNGLSPANYQFFKTQFMHSHGFEHIATWHNLKRVGMLVEQDMTQAPKGQLGKVAATAMNLTRSSHYRAISKKLNLVPNATEVNLKLPNDMSYVFSAAYAPISVKLVEQILNRGGFTGLDDITKHIPGQHFSHTEGQSVRAAPSPHARASNASKIVLVLFAGGCTYSEITALRFLGRQKGYQFLVATTSMTNGNSLINLIRESNSP